MELLLVLCLFVVSFGGVVALVGGVLYFARWQRDRSLRAFADLAQHYQLTLVGPQAMRGTFGRGQLEVTLTSESRGSGKHRRSVSVTRYRITHPARLRMGLRVTAQAAFFGDVADALGLANDVKVGRPDLDDVVRIKGADPDHLRAVLTDDAVARALIAARNLSRFQVDDEGAFAQHDGWVTAGPTMESFVRPLGAVVDSLSASRARHRAGWEHQLDRVWGALAAAEGFQYVPEHSVLRASAHAGTVELFVGVGAGLVTHTRVTVARPLDQGLNMYRSGALSAVGSFFGMQDVTIGVPVLDEAYVIKARHEQGVRATLLGISGDLLALHESLTDLTLRDAGLEGRRGELMLDPIALTALLRALLRVLDGLAGQSPQPQSAFR